MLRRIRIILAAVFFVGLTLLFLDFTGTAHRWLGWMAKAQFLPAILALNVVVVLVLIALTLLFGRIYCSVVCPLGILQDIFGWVGKKVKKNRYSFSPEKRILRYCVLGAFFVAFIAGVATIVQLLAPYSAFGRIATMLLQPLWQLGNNVLAGFSELADSYTFYSVDVWLKSLPVLIVAVATLVALIVLAWRGGRTYCNTICPVGTLLSLFARYSWLRIQFHPDKCRNCGLCTKNCKASCVDFKNHTVDYSRCVVCGDCLKSCKFGALKYAPVRKTGTPATGPKQADPTDTSRRSFLLASAMVATSLLAEEERTDRPAKLAPIEPKVSPERKTPITPPGSRSADNMLRRCTGCQLCVSDCPNGVLRPSGDMMTMMMPVMSYERGYCRPECTRCSEVCPSGAIIPVGKEDKQHIQIGHAVVASNLCVSALGKDECGNCERHCPVQAIEMVPSDPDDDFSPYVPAINSSLCIGCGACEYVCPVRPLSAIHVEGLKEHGQVKSHVDQSISDDEEPDNEEVLDDEELNEEELSEDELDNEEEYDEE